jgi:hypothetical protein
MSIAIDIPKAKLLFTLNNHYYYTTELPDVFDPTKKFGFIFKYNPETMSQTALQEFMFQNEYINLVVNFSRHMAPEALVEEYIFYANLEGFFFRYVKVFTNSKIENTAPKNLKMIKEEFNPDEPVEFTQGLSYYTFKIKDIELWPPEATEFRSAFNVTCENTNIKFQISGVTDTMYQQALNKIGKEVTVSIENKHDLIDNDYMVFNPLIFYIHY